MSGRSRAHPWFAGELPPYTNRFGYDDGEARLRDMPEEGYEITVPAACPCCGGTLEQRGFFGIACYVCPACCGEVPR